MPEHPIVQALHDKVLEEVTEDWDQLSADPDAVAWRVARRLARMVDPSIDLDEDPIIGAPWSAR